MIVDRILEVVGILFLCVLFFILGNIYYQKYEVTPCTTKCSCEKEEVAIYREMTNLVIARDELWECKQDLAVLSNEQNHDILCTDSYCAGP